MDLYIVNFIDFYGSLVDCYGSVMDCYHLFGSR